MQLKKLFLIALKDLRLIFRDPSALVLMLLAPFLLTIGMGALTGRFSGGTGTGVSNIAVEIVNEDNGILGEVLIEVFQSPDLGELVSPSIHSSLTEAKARVDSNQSAAVVVIPQGFTDSIMMMASDPAVDEVLQIEFYTNPTMPTSVGVLRSILDQFINQVEIGRVSAMVIVSQLVENGLIPPEQAVGLGGQIGQQMGGAVDSPSSIRVETNLAEGEGIRFDILAYMAPGMAMMFLMFTVTYGARSLLVENQAGTLPRLLVAPTRPAYVLGGKFTGIFFSAIAQLVILIGGTTLMFGLRWGDALGVTLLILAAAFGATGWGMLFAAVLKTPGQIAISGSAVMLIFGLLGGSFFDLSMLPGWIQVINKITPNAWANDGFYILSLGGKLKAIQPNLISLVIMGAVLFVVATFWINKRGLVRK
ncbi:MAG: ABC transporter permease [Brevefilum sp.]|nr:ABC transporter permease [Brevefilum sp.]